jgi:hypothetical protein
VKRLKRWMRQRMAHAALQALLNGDLKYKVVVRDMAGRKFGIAVDGILVPQDGVKDYKEFTLYFDDDPESVGPERRNPGQTGLF